MTRRAHGGSLLFFASLLVPAACASVAVDGPSGDSVAQDCGPREL